MCGYETGETQTLFIKFSGVSYHEWSIIADLNMKIKVFSVERSLNRGVKFEMVLPIIGIRQFTRSV